MQATRHSTVRLALGSVLIGTIPVATTAVAQAVQQVVADPGAPAAQRPTMTESLNKTPVQNIVAPNASGLSHNKLQQFNVDQRNLIINNSRVNAVSSIGGAVVANPNLAGGEARIILNEVTGGSRSVLQGNQELLGGRAAYILANPNGITCDGCGFLNFPRVTMTTGVPVIDGDVLRGLRVNGGDVRIGAGGLNTQGLDAFDILSRALVVEGVLKAPDLRVVAGRNEVAYDSLVATPLAPDGSAAPSWAIDSSVLGGMYAGRISLVSTEAGVGVRLQGEVAASVDDVTLNAAGRIQLKGALTAQRDVRLASSAAAAGVGPEIELDGARVYAGQDARVQGGDLLLRGGRLGAGRDLSVRAASLQDTGLAPAVGEDAKAQRLRDAGRNLSVNVDGAATLNASAWQAGQQMSWLADSLTLSDAAVQSGGNASLNLRTLTLDAASFAAGAKGLRSGGVLDLQVTQTLDNAGLIAGDAGLNLRAGSLTNRSGALIQSGAAQAADASITVTGALTQAGTIGSTGDLTVTAQSLNSQAGEISAQDELTLAVSGTWTNAQNAKAQAKVLSATAGNLNNAGVVHAQQALTLTATTLGNLATGQLTSGGIPAVDLHGNLSQNARDRNLADFSSGAVKVLVATDVAARGVHVDGVDLVVHVDPPAEHKAYLHRSGRTARAGAAGDVVTLMLPSQRKDTEGLLRRAGIGAKPQAVTTTSPQVVELIGEVAERVAPRPGGPGVGNAPEATAPGTSQGANARRKRAARSERPGETAVRQGGRRGGQGQRSGEQRRQGQGSSQGQARGGQPAPMYSTSTGQGAQRPASSATTPTRRGPRRASSSGTAR